MQEVSIGNSVRKFAEKPDLSTTIRHALLESLREVADPQKAPGMQAYMKSEMPYLGVQTPPLKRICQTVFKANPLESQTQWLETILDIWRKAEYREERYAAINLSSQRKYLVYINLKAVPAFEEMVIDGAWWDYVDAIATRLFSVLLRNHKAEMTALLLEWAHCSDIWKRRVSIICQLSFKEETDVGLLYNCIEPSIENSEFFLRKGIGWALREYAKTDPAAVIRFVNSKADRLSRLSKREALRILIKDGHLVSVP